MNSLRILIVVLIAAMSATLYGESKDDTAPAADTTVVNDNKDEQATGTKILKSESVADEDKPKAGQASDDTDTEAPKTDATETDSSDGTTHSTHDTMSSTSADDEEDDDELDEDDC